MTDSSLGSWDPTMSNGSLSYPDIRNGSYLKCDVKLAGEEPRPFRLCTCAVCYTGRSGVARVKKNRVGHTGSHSAGLKVTI